MKKLTALLMLTPSIALADIQLDEKIYAPKKAKVNSIITTQGDFHMRIENKTNTTHMYKYHAYIETCEGKRSMNYLSSYRIKPGEARDKHHFINFDTLFDSIGDRCIIAIQHVYDAEESYHQTSAPIKIVY